jgi:hypothetical protein
VDLIVTGSAQIVSQDALATLTMSPNSFNVNTTGKQSTPAEGYIFGPTGSNAQFYLGVYDFPNLTTDVELNVKVDSSNGISFKDWDNVTAGDYIPFMNIAPNLGNNPAPQFTRGLGITGSLNVTGSIDITGNYYVNGVAFSGGTSGTSGDSGSSGTSGDSGSSGTSGIDGTSGTSGVNGTDGSSGTSGTGTAGTSGSSGTSASGGGGITQITGVTFLSSSWSLSSSLYIYDYSNSGITTSSFVMVIPSNTSITTVTAAQILPQTDSASGSVRLYASYLPTGNISGTINIQTIS